MRHENELKTELSVKQVLHDLGDLYNTMYLEAKRSPIGKRDYLNLVQVYIELKKLEAGNKEVFDWSEKKKPARRTNHAR